MLQTARWPVAKVKKDEKEVSGPMDGCMSDSDDSDPLDSVAEGNHDDTSIDEKDFWWQWLWLMLQLQRQFCKL